jgi:hypothetical protein
VFPSDVLVGKTVYIDNDRIRNAAYVIGGLHKSGQDRFVLDIGDATLIREYAAPNDPDQGYVYDICLGQSFRIPMTYEWNNPIKNSLK